MGPGKRHGEAIIVMFWEFNAVIFKTHRGILSRESVFLISHVCEAESTQGIGQLPSRSSRADFPWEKCLGLILKAAMKPRRTLTVLQVRKPHARSYYPIIIMKP